MIRWQSIFGIFLILILSGCTSAQISNYNFNLEHALDWTKEPDNKETIMPWYFGVLGFNPYGILCIGETTSGYLSKYFFKAGIELKGETVDRTPAQYEIGSTKIPKSCGQP